MTTDEFDRTVTHEARDVEVEGNEWHYRRPNAVDRAPVRLGAFEAIDPDSGDWVFAHARIKTVVVKANDKETVSAEIQMRLGDPPSQLALGNALKHDAKRMMLLFEFGALCLDRSDPNLKRELAFPDEVDNAPRTAALAEAWNEYETAPNQATP